MNSFFSRASLKHSARNHGRKNSISEDTDIACSPRKIRPPPLQIIPELLESMLDIDASPTCSPATARPTQSFPQPELKTSRITLSAYTFSIDNALLMLANGVLRSPALSASSSTSDGASSEDVPITPRTLEGQDEFDSMLPISRLCPRRISVRPLCIAKARSSVCQEDEDAHSYFEKEEKKAVSLLVTEEQLEHPAEAQVATEDVEGAEQDFYIQEFVDFISLSPVVPSPTSPARRDSLILTTAALPTIIDVSPSKPSGRSRLSKPLPLLPPITPPISTFPSVTTLPIMQTTAQESVVRRKRNFPSHPNPPAQPPSESRSLPQKAVPLNVEDCIFLEEVADIPSHKPTSTDQVHAAKGDAAITCLLPSAIPLAGMYSEAVLPHSSTDSGGPRSSTDSRSSAASSNTPISPLFFASSPSSEGPELESTQCLRSRWSSSTLGSLAIEPPPSMTLFSPLKSVLGSRARWALLPPQKAAPQTPPHPKLPKNKQGNAMTLPLGGKRVRRRGSRSSTSSGGTITSECDSHEGSPSGLKRKPIPVAIFLRAT